MFHSLYYIPIKKPCLKLCSNSMCFPKHTVQRACPLACITGFFLWRIGIKMQTAPHAHAPEISRQLFVAVGATYLRKIFLK